MRVVGGEFGGRRLRVPAGRVTRPTSDLVRGALFDALEARLLSPGRAALAGRRALDLFAGSGALGIEALSRGCERAWFVEQDAGALAALRANLATLGIRGRARVWPRPVEAALRDPAFAEARIGLAIADPPYTQGAGAVLVAAGGARWLAADALCALQHRAGEELPTQSGTLRLVWRRTYGGTEVSVYATSAAGA